MVSPQQAKENKMNIYPENPFVGQEITVNGVLKQWNGVAWNNITHGNHELRLQALESEEKNNADYLTLDEAKAAPLEVGQYVRITDRDYALAKVEASGNPSDDGTDALNNGNFLIVVQDLVDDIEKVKVVDDKNTSLSIFDMHFGVLKGQGQTGSVNLGQIDYTLPVNSLSGSYQIQLTSTTNLNDNDLIVYLAQDGEYYTNVISSISGSILNLKEPIIVSIDAGQNLWNGWNDLAHVTPKGYYAIADYLLRDKIKCYDELSDSAKYIAKNGVPINEITQTNNSEYPGSFKITTYELGFDGGVNQRVDLELGVLECNNYRLDFQLNTELNDCSVRVISKSNNFVVCQKDINKKTCSTVQLDFKTYKADDYVLQIFSQTPVYIASTKLLRLNDSIISLKGRKLLLLGDSWFAAGHIPDRLNERLPDTDIVNKGVSGNNAQNILDRFDADVTPEDPDVVWLNTSTNDYFGSSDAEIYFYRLTQIQNKIANIGASCITSTPTVANVDVSLSRFDRSRYFYFDNPFYLKEMEAEDQIIHVNIDAIETSINGQAKTFAYLGFYDGFINISESYVNYDVEVYAGPNVGSQSKVGDIQSGYIAASSTIPCTGFVTLKALNTTGSAEVLNGYIRAVKGE